MNALRSWVVADGLAVALRIQSAALTENSPENTLWFIDSASLLAWVTAVVMGMHVVYVIVMMVRATYLRRKDGTRRRRGRVRHGK